MGSIQESSGITWIAVRLGLILAAFLYAGTFIRSMPGDFSQRSLRFFIELVGLLVPGAMVVLGFAKRGSAPEPSWQLPRWSDNPFKRLDPLSIFHLSALEMISLGVGALLVGQIMRPKNWAWELPLSAGCALWLAARVMAEPSSSVAGVDL